jgi:hypothetical protein
MENLKGGVDGFCYFHWFSNQNNSCIYDACSISFILFVFSIHFCTNCYIKAYYYPVDFFQMCMCCSWYFIPFSNCTCIYWIHRLCQKTLALNPSLVKIGEGYFCSGKLSFRPDCQNVFDTVVTVNPCIVEMSKAWSHD